MYKCYCVRACVSVFASARVRACMRMCARACVCTYELVGERACVRIHASCACVRGCLRFIPLICTSHAPEENYIFV